MTLGKTLRLRRVFSQGRALVAVSDPRGTDPLAYVRLLARSGADAVIVTPGPLELVAEEVGGLAVILRIDGGIARAQPLVSVRAALEMGADAVAVAVEASSPAAERFGRVSEEARRLGMPLLAEVGGEDWMEAAQLSAEYGADLISAPFQSEAGAWRSWVRATGKPLLASLDVAPGAVAPALEAVWQLMQGPAQGILLGALPLQPAESGRFLEAVHALVHQDVSLEEARAAVGLPPDEP